MARPAAFITGAAQGIGAAIALAFARAGYDLAISSTDKNKLTDSAAAAKAAGARVATISLNVTEQSSIEAGFKEAVDTLGALDVLVNNAAITMPRMAVDVTRENWAGIMNTNLTGTFFMCQQMGRHLIAAKRPGTILSITSTHGVLGFPLRSTYGISKAAVMHMARMLAIEWAEHGIRVNALAPGVVRTPLAAMLTENPELAAGYLKLTPLGRFGETDDIGAAAAFLASADAAYITGHLLVVDGGITAGIDFIPQG